MDNIMKTKYFISRIAGIFLALPLFTVVTVAATANSTESPIKEPLKWKSSAPVVTVKSDNTNNFVSIKDPTIVRYDGKWHIYATVANKQGHWNMIYTSFSDWSEADSAEQIHLGTVNPDLSGYHCAPQIFYFRPQQKWYLIYQSQPPSYSTTDDITDPTSWSEPQYFYKSAPSGVPNLWIDYWIICDDKNAYMFSSGDDGRFYRCQTKLENFPNGFSDPVVVMETPNRFGLFEASCVYKLKGTNQYLAFIEAIGKDGNRYFKGFLSDSLDGEWTPFHASEDDPFAGLANVTYEDGVTPWTRDISHGEILRDGYDETLTVDPDNLVLLYQGLPIETPRDLDYSQLPYRLALLHQDTPEE